MIEAKDVEAGSRECPAPCGTSTDVMLAEDDPVNRQVLQHWLESWGHRVSLAKDGPEIWQMLEQSTPHLIILNSMMRGIESTDACRKIRAQRRNPSPYILLITSQSGDSSEVMQGLDAGADDYLRKPCESGELRARVSAGQRALKMQAELTGAKEALRFSAAHDPLTGLWNHASILALLDKELKRASRTQASVGLLMVDIDHFKKINDVYGHVAGDLVLKEVSRRVQHSVRSYDMVGRYGGEEVVVVLPDCHPEDTQTTGERVRLAVAETAIAGGNVDINVTVSIGAASMSGANSPGDLLARVDSALCRAKETGRDRTESYSKSRRWVRHKVDVPIRVILPRPSKTTIIDGRGYEVSEGGMALTAGVELDVEDEIMVEFTPPYSGLPIRVRGTVRNRHGYRYGIEFLREGSKESEQVDHLRMMLSGMAKAE